jgi:tetratricopeptide (TPR) repeat protein
MPDADRQQERVYQRSVEVDQPHLTLSGIVSGLVQHSLDPGHQATFGALLRQHRRAAGLTQEALAERAGLSLRSLDDDWSIGWSAGRLSHVRWTQGRHAEAAALAQEAIIRFRVLKAPWYLGWALHQRGRIAHSAGDDELAERLFNESLASLHDAGDRGFATGFQFANLGDVAAARGELDRAAKLYEQALLALQPLGFKQGLVHTLHSRAHVWRKLGNRLRAIEDEREALGICQDVW